MLRDSALCLPTYATISPSSLCSLITSNHISRYQGPLFRLHTRRNYRISLGVLRHSDALRMLSIRFKTA